jgi:opacity protein-like surface antigen
MTQFDGLRAETSLGLGSRSSRTAKRAKLGGMTLLLVIGGFSAAQAQCVNSNTGPFAILGLGPAASSTVTSLVSVTNAVNTAYLTQTSAFIASPSSPTPDQTNGGVWTRAVAGEAEIKSSSTMNASATTAIVTPNGGVAFNQNQTSNCNVQNQIPYVGYQAGIDLAKLNLGNSGTNVYFGATVGYLSGTGTNVTTGVGPNDFGGQFQVPFVGLYGSVVHGGFFADAQVLANFYQMQLSSFAMGLFDQGLNAHGWSATTNVGYQHDLGNNWFVEPSAGVTWSRTVVDPLSVAGTLFLANSTGGFVPPGMLHINDIDSVLGRIGVRVGTSFTVGNFYVQPFASAALWHEFAGDVTATFGGAGAIVSTNPPFVLASAASGNFSVSRVGTFGQVGAGLGASMLGTGWYGYGRVDLREGENITAVALNLGLRYQFEPPKGAPAPGIFKAKAPPAPIVEVYNWTGFYLGGLVSTGWGETDWTPPIGPGTSPKMAGFLGGAEAGFNYQIGSIVLGVEGDVLGVDTSAPGAPLGELRGSAACPNGFFFTCNEQLRYLASLTARVGFNWERTLFFVKGGAAWTKNDYSATCNTDSQPLIVGPLCNNPADIASDTRSGWTVGGGFEYGLSRHWSAKAEYDYYDFGSKTTVFSDGEVASIKETVNVVKIGVNYRFVPDVVVAKY